MCMMLVCPMRASAVLIIEVDTDGADDGVLTYSPNFSFGGDTTTASQSVPSAAVGMTGGDSIFGGDGSAEPDTYVFTYDLDVDGDNVALGAGTALNDDGDVASGLTAGLTGTYNVYATWPFTSNVSGGATRYKLLDGGATLFSVDIDQNGIALAGAGNEWVLLGSAALDASKTYTLTQEPTGSNTFVSMRAAGVLFDRVTGSEPIVPEPLSATLTLTSLAVLGMSRRYRRT